jgi:hypothetical protein
VTVELQHVLKCFWEDSQDFSHLAVGRGRRREGRRKRRWGVEGEESYRKSKKEGGREGGRESERKRERMREWLGGSYRGIFPSIVVEDSVPTWMLVCPVCNIVNLVINHQPLVGLLIVSLDFLPGVSVETLVEHIALAIYFLPYIGLRFPICYWFSICLMYLV